MWPVSAWTLLIGAGGATDVAVSPTPSKSATRSNPSVRFAWTWGRAPIIAWGLRLASPPPPPPPRDKKKKAEGGGGGGRGGGARGSGMVGFLPKRRCF